jgi:hypothetical protein
MRSGRKWVWNGFRCRAKVKSALMNTSPGCNGLATRHSGEAAFTKGGALVQNIDLAAYVLADKDVIVQALLDMLMELTKEESDALLESVTF